MRPSRKYPPIPTHTLPPGHKLPPSFYFPFNKPCRPSIGCIPGPCYPVTEVNKWQQQPKLQHRQQQRTPFRAGYNGRAAVNRANSAHSTGPRTESGKQRSSLNALSHGLTARTAVLPTEDPEAYQRHIQQFLDEYKPATPTETQLVHEIANTAWRLNRIPFLEAELLSQDPNPQP